MDFESRKNKAVLENGRVIKTFTDPAAFANEKERLLLLDGRFAPKLICARGLTLETEYIVGDLLLTRYLAASPAEAAALAALAAQTVKGIHSAAGGQITYDENFRNYIVSGNKIFRVDFEETRAGTLLEWWAKLSAFAALYDVGLPVKKIFIRNLANALNLPEASLFATLTTEIDLLAARWRVPAPAAIDILD